MKTPSEKVVINRFRLDPHQTTYWQPFAPIKIGDVIFAFNFIAIENETDTARIYTIGVTKNGFYTTSKRARKTK